MVSEIFPTIWPMSSTFRFPNRGDLLILGRPAKASHILVFLSDALAQPPLSRERVLCLRSCCYRFSQSTQYFVKIYACAGISPVFTLLFVFFLAKRPPDPPSEAVLISQFSRLLPEFDLISSLPKHSGLWIQLVRISVSWWDLFLQARFVT